MGLLRRAPTLHLYPIISKAMSGVKYSHFSKHHILKPHPLSLRRISLLPLVQFQGRGSGTGLSPVRPPGMSSWAMVVGSGGLGGRNTVALILLLCGAVSLGQMLFSSLSCGRVAGWAKAAPVLEGHLPLACLVGSVWPLFGCLHLHPFIHFS